MSNSIDPEKLSFSQAQGYEELPAPLKLEELNQEARTKIWNYLYIAVSESLDTTAHRIVKEPWLPILAYLHVEFFSLPLDEFSSWHRDFINKYKEPVCGLYPLPFNKIFDLLQHIMRHPECPPSFIDDVAETFKQCRLAYIVRKEPPVTIFPATTKTEGEAILEALRQLHENEFHGAETHLRNASDFINQGNHANSIRESIHAVESVARKLDPKASNSLDKALKALEDGNPVHPALKEALLKLYGYTSNEEGIRHSLIDEGQANVGMDEAIFMLGACASFSSYLLRKYKA